MGLQDYSKLDTSQSPIGKLNSTTNKTKTSFVNIEKLLNGKNLYSNFEDERKFEKVIAQNQFNIDPKSLRLRFFDHFKENDSQITGRIYFSSSLEKESETKYGSVFKWLEEEYIQRSKIQFKRTASLAQNAIRQ